MRRRLSRINNQQVINVRLDSKDSNGDEVTAHNNHRLWESLRRPCRSKFGEIHIDFPPTIKVEIDATKEREITIEPRGENDQYP